MKHIILGTDEAGYGPNLGPFVVSCTEWGLPEKPFDDTWNDLDLLQNQLKTVVSDKPDKNGQKIVIGDSKKLHHSQKPTQTLEETLFFVLKMIGRTPKNWQELLNILATDDMTSVLEEYCCTKNFSESKKEDFLIENFTSTGVLFRNISSRIIVPKLFNENLDKLGNKSNLLSHFTLGLIAKHLKNIPDGQVTIICDKHGGRNHYLGILYHWFPEHSINVITEGRNASIYRFEMSEKQVEIRFLAKADNLIPTGLASMASKYLREFCMEIFNHFWQQHVPNLKPTAGYPVDAVRFYTEIEPTAAKLGIPKEHLWRKA